jgi:hypothetical protein
MATSTTTPTFADLGTTFNDATRFLEGGLWQNAVQEGAQGPGSVFSYTSDLQTVQTGLQAEIAAGQFTGATLTNVQTILGDITTALSAATASVNGGGTFGSITNAEEALHNSHLDILNVVNNDPNLVALATQNGATGFMALPQGLNGGAAADAPHANLAEIGVIFNDAADAMVGGVNANNVGQITNDVNAVITDLQQLMQAQPQLFGGLTGIHADTVVKQMQLELTFINETNASPDAARAENDNMLDIIDIVQGDTNLANMATQNGLAGFAPFPDFANATPRYQDNADQTQFWANFIAQSNDLGTEGVQLAGSGNTSAIKALIAQLHTFATNESNFDAAQGGIFEARFDNELLAPTSTTGADVAAMIKALQTGNVALAMAASDGFHADAADVSGNNIPVTGGTYDSDGTTVAQALSTAGAAATTASSITADPASSAAAPAPAPATPPATTTVASSRAPAPTAPAASSTAPNPASDTNGNGTTPAKVADNTGNHHDLGPADFGGPNFGHADFGGAHAAHLEHMWG